MHTRRTVTKVMVRRIEDDTGPPQYPDLGVASTHLPIMEIRTC